MGKRRNPTAAKDFRRLDQEGHRQSLGKAIGQGFCTARDAIARLMLGVGITPNLVTLAGLFATCLAAACLFHGGGYSHATLRTAGLPPYLWFTAALLVLASAGDMLDGALARVGNLYTPLGAVLDSSLDRISDAVLYIGLVGHFIVRGNLTYGVLAAVAMTNALLISYVKARSENMIPDCSVGYWVRGERCAALLIAAIAGTMPAVLWQQAILPAFTVLRRVVWSYQVLAAKTAGKPLPSSATPLGLAGLLRPWRYPRGSVPYDVVTLANILFIVFAHRVSPLFGPDADPLRRLLGVPV